MNINDQLNDSKNILNQMPNFLMLSTVEHKISFVNDLAARVMGFKSSKEAVDVHYANIKCQAAEDAEVFCEQDKLVFSRLEKVTTLGYHRYKNADDWALILCEKSPLFNPRNELIGVITYWLDATNHNLIDYSQFIYFSIKENTPTYKNSFILSSRTMNPYRLSDRQLECLFFLLRGQSAKTIAKILSLSPRTIESYLNEIKNKMSCSTQADIIEKALSEGLLNILPHSFIKSKFGY